MTDPSRGSQRSSPLKILSHRARESRCGAASADASAARLPGGGRWTGPGWAHAGGRGCRSLGSEAHDRWQGGGIRP